MSKGLYLDSCPTIDYMYISRLTSCHITTSYTCTASCTHAPLFALAIISSSVAVKDGQLVDFARGIKPGYDITFVHSMHFRPNADQGVQNSRFQSLRKYNTIFVFAISANAFSILPTALRMLALCCCNISTAFGLCS